jgi:hypothetical protein
MLVFKFAESPEYLYESIIRNFSGGFIGTEITVYRFQCKSQVFFVKNLLTFRIIGSTALYQV